MTVSYSGEVPNGGSFGIFWKILWKWRGSVYKLIWRELLAYLCLYYAINLVYRYALTREQQVSFQNVRQYFGEQKDSIPMSFVLGFYVNLVVKRWWEQFRLLPWPDTLALLVSTAIPGNHETGRLMRRNIVRYSILAYVITLRTVSLRVKKRFPEWQHLVDAGLMHESEQKIFEIMDEKTAMSKYWMPLVWATNIINRARKEGYISCDHLVQTILNELSDVRWRLGSLIGYDTVCVPLVYTQVVTHVIYVYFIAALVGRQMVEIKDPVTGHVTLPDLYFPLFTALQFCFYVGWLKVAAVLINPFGEDDDDIELSWMIDRHIKAAYMIVDEMHEEHPELLKDQYWEEVVPKELPYTIAAEQYRRKEPKGSAETYKVKEADSVYANLIPSKKQSHHSHHTDDAYADYESVDTPIMNRRKSWFVRQISKMGSFRSSSSALFAKNNCNNSVYSSPEIGAIPPVSHHETHPSRKLSLYEIFVGRKSARAKLKQLGKQQSKASLNTGHAGPSSKERPRVPSPEVTNEVFEKNFKYSNAKKLSTVSHGRNISDSDVALMAKKLAKQQTLYHQSSNNSMNDPVIGTLILSPINEIDLNNSATSTFSYPSENGRSIVIPSNGEAKINVEDLGKSLPAGILPLKITTIPSKVSSDHLSTSSDTNSRRGRFVVSNSFDESSLPEPESVSTMFKTNNRSSRSSPTANSSSSKNSPKLNNSTKRDDNKNSLNRNNDKGGEVYV